MQWLVIIKFLWPGPIDVAQGDVDINDLEELAVEVPVLDLVVLYRRQYIWCHIGT